MRLVDGAPVELAKAVADGPHPRLARAPPGPGGAHPRAPQPDARRRPRGDGLRKGLGDGVAGPPPPLDPGREALRRTSRPPPWGKRDRRPARAPAPATSPRATAPSAPIVTTATRAPAAQSASAASLALAETPTSPMRRASVEVRPGHEGAVDHLAAEVEGEVEVTPPVLADVGIEEDRQSPIARQPAGLERQLPLGLVDERVRSEDQCARMIRPRRRGGRRPSAARPRSRRRRSGRSARGRRSKVTNASGVCRPGTCENQSSRTPSASQPLGEPDAPAGRRRPRRRAPRAPRPAGPRRRRLPALPRNAGETSRRRWVSRVRARRPDRRSPRRGRGSGLHHRSSSSRGYARPVVTRGARVDERESARRGDQGVHAVDRRRRRADRVRPWPPHQLGGLAAVHASASRARRWRRTCPGGGAPSARRRPLRLHHERPGRVLRPLAGRGRGRRLPAGLSRLGGGLADRGPGPPRAGAEPGA